MLFKLKHTFFIFLITITFAGCISKKQMTRLEQSNAYKEQLNKKNKRAAEKSRKKTRKRQYNIQASNTKDIWNSNKKKSDKWRNEKFHKKSLSYKIRKFFDNFRRDPKPESGLFSKKQSRKKKGISFSRIFKKKK